MGICGSLPIVTHPLADLAPRIVVRERTHPAGADFAAYCKFIHGVDLAPHHHEWVRVLETERAPRFLIVAPPETWKSRVLRMYLEWRIGRNPEECWLLVMRTEKQAMGQVLSVRATIENNGRYHELFPSIRPAHGHPWGQDTLFVERRNLSRPEATLFGTGIYGPYQGVHVEGTIMDDITAQADVESPDEMEKQERHIRGVLIDRNTEFGRMFGLMTRWGMNDLLHVFRDLDFKVIEMPIIGDYPWGTLLWEEKFPLERIEQARRDKKDLFALTYLCRDDVEDAEPLFSGWQYYDKLPEGVLWVTSWDTAGTRTRTAAYSCGITLGRKGQDIFLKDLARGRWEYPDLRKKALECYKVQRAPLWIEEKATGQSLVQDLRNLGREEGVIIPIVSIRLGKKYGMDGDKITRAKVAARYVQAGHVWLPRNAPWLAAFLAECHLLGRYMDQVDALSQGVIRLMRTKHTGDLQVQFPGADRALVAPTIKQMRERRILREVSLRVVA